MTLRQWCLFMVVLPIVAAVTAVALLFSFLTSWPFRPSPTEEQT